MNEHCPHTSYINNNIFINLILTMGITMGVIPKKYFLSYNCTKKVSKVRYSVFLLKLKTKIAVTVKHTTVCSKELLFMSWLN